MDKGSNTHGWKGLETKLKHFQILNLSNLKIYTDFQCCPLYQYIFEAFVEGTHTITKENSNATRFGHVKVFVGGPWYTPIQGKIRNLVIETKDGKSSEKVSWK